MIVRADLHCESPYFHGLWHLYLNVLRNPHNEVARLSRKVRLILSTEGRLWALNVCMWPLPDAHQHWAHRRTACPFHQSSQKSHKCRCHWAVQLRWILALKLTQSSSCHEVGDGKRKAVSLVAAEYLIPIGDCRPCWLPLLYCSYIPGSKASKHELMVV